MQLLLIDIDDTNKAVTSDYFKNNIVLSSDKSTIFNSSKNTDEEKKTYIKHDKKDDVKNYAYWKDVYLACSKGGDKKLPMGWLSEDHVHLYSSIYKPAEKKSTT